MILEVATVLPFARSREPGTKGAACRIGPSQATSSRRSGSSRGTALELLRDRHADAVEHLNGTLLDHLERTEQLLRAWGSSAALATAGLCHAAYGTDGYAPALLNLDERTLLAAAVGPHVEATVYFYASCDRRFLYPRIGVGEWDAFRDRFT